MKIKLSKNRAISTVLTTIIILMASVILGAGVVLYGTSLFKGGIQQESISVSGVKIWVHATDPNGLAWGAAGIRNTGDKVVAIDKIQIRGTGVPFTSWYPDTTVTLALFQQAFIHPGWNGLTLIDNSSLCGSETIQIDLGGTATDDICANAGLGPVSIEPGASAIIYFRLNNGTLSSLDSGTNTNVSIFAGNIGAPQSITVQGKS